MEIRNVTATEMSRNFADLLNQVRYQGLTLNVTRGKDIVARILPPDAQRGTDGHRGYPLAQLDALIARLPSLQAGDESVFLNDLQVERVRYKIEPARENEWDS